MATDTSRPDYTCPQYNEMEPRWTLVEDVRGGTDVVRAKKETYLPKFEAEDTVDWATRVAMSYLSDSYASTLTEHVGMIMADGVTLGEDVPPQIQELCEDVDGEGNHIDVWATQVADAAMHFGHSVILTDYPVADGIRTRADEQRVRARPYATLYKAPDVLSWDFATVGGVRVLTRIMLRETTTEPDGEFGTKAVVRYREIKQDVQRDPETQRATGLGAVTFRVWQRQEGGAADQFAEVDKGTIVGPERIAARIVYGGEKLASLHTKPHLHALAMSSVEELQVASDEAMVMHKTNVPTPVFIGRQPQDPTQGTTIKMGRGIDIPPGGNAFYMEPSGSALSATANKLARIQARMQRQGASTADGEGGKVMSATEAAQYAKARNAKLKKAARSFQDAMEGMLSDMAAFMGLESGGSVSVTQDFAGQTIDPQYLSVLLTAFEKGAISIEELRSVLQTGQLPEEYEYADVINLLADRAAKEAQEREAEAERLAAMQEAQNQPPQQMAA